MVLAIGMILPAHAQKYMTRNGHIFFKSNAEIDDGVEANNESVACVLDASNGNVAFQVLITAFQFEKALMQEHFNENYLESEKYPKSTFAGKIDNWKDVDMSKPGTYEVTVSGKLTIHGETNEVSQPGKLIVKEDGSVVMTTHMLVPLADYNIEIPSVVADKIAKEIDVDIDVTLNKV
jgi:polyisoprenoid-binding protein YceI